MPVGGAVKGIADGTSVERIEFEVDGVGYWIEILKDPPARVWNALKMVKPGETAFDQDTRVLGTALVEWDLGAEITDAALEDLREPVRLAMVKLTTDYYVELQKKHADILAHIYRPGGDGPTDPSSGSATASASPARSKASRRTR
jgi:hypothetical protein